MKTKLSHSQVSRYSLCGQAFKYHYVDRIRPTTQSAALCFGTALDDALNVLVTNSGNPEQKFIDSFTKQHVNGSVTYLPTCIDLVYAESDYDAELITDEDKDVIDAAMEGGTISKVLNPFTHYDELRKKKKENGFANLKTDEKCFYNYLNWLSLMRKGLLMLQAYRKKVLAKIQKVHAVQKYVELENETGDKIIGYVDMVADLEGHGTVIIDHKTSAMEYDEDAVLISPQLSLYMHILEQEYNTRKAGYIVLRKSVIKNRKKTCSVCGHDGTGGRHKTCDKEVAGKRCGGEWTEAIDPDINIQIIIDEIPTLTEKVVIENYDETNKAIKSGVYPRNFSSCSNTYGGDCPYKALCFKGSMKNLKKF